MTPMKRIFNKGTISVWTGVFIGILYGLVVRLVFNYGKFWEAFAFMTVGFIFFVPVTLGVLTVYFGDWQGRKGWAYKILMPWVSCLVLLLAAFLIGWEGSICILMALPVFLVMSSLGGVFTGLALQATRSRKNTFSVIALFVALPFLSASIEHQLLLPESVRTVETQITINASPHDVWQNIERVRKIEPSEQKFSLFHLLGFPRPVEATLSHEAVGGVRHATFEGGVLFVETINKWAPDRELTFAIKADSKSIPPTTLDEHVTIGGPYFDVLEGSYRIESLNERQVILHLSSKHRLSTRLNFYAGLWTEFIMRDIQKNILEIIKTRCENR